jgi:hypothetical protein
VSTCSFPDLLLSRDWGDKLAFFVRPEGLESVAMDCILVHLLLEEAEFDWEFVCCSKVSLYSYPGFSFRSGGANELSLCISLGVLGSASVDSSSVCLLLKEDEFNGVCGCSSNASTCSFTDFFL